MTELWFPVPALTGDVVWLRPWTEADVPAIVRAFTDPVKKYMDEKSAYLKSQLGNPEGPEKPNKKHIDPRVWLHLAEKGMAGRLVQAFKELGAYGKFEF